MSFRCRLCDQLFDQISENAIAVGRKRHGLQLYMIDGQVHDLTKVRRPPVVGVVNPASKPKPEPQPAMAAIGRIKNF